MDTERVSFVVAKQPGQGSRGNCPVHIARTMQMSPVSFAS